jgi:hypothetical protein
MPDATTYLNLPFPLDSERIALGAQNIEDLATQDEANQLLLNNTFSSDAPYTSYPVGYSIMRISGGQPGWPYGYGQVITFKHKDGSNALQFWNAQSTVVARQQVMYRIGYSNNGEVWTEWRPVGSPQGAAQLVATGRAVVPGKTSGFATLTVTFPSGLFSNTPAVVLQMQTASSPSIGYSVGSVGPSSFEIIVDRPSGTDSTIWWIAASNYSSFG